jgi:hypothetical protein
MIIEPLLVLTFLSKAFSRAFFFCAFDGEKSFTACFACASVIRISFLPTSDYVLSVSAPILTMAREIATDYVGAFNKP